MKALARIDSPKLWKTNVLADALEKYVPDIYFAKSSKEFYSLLPKTYILITNRYTAEDNCVAKNLQHVIVPTSGLENINQGLLASRGITLHRKPEIYADSVANYVVSAIEKLTKTNLCDALRNKTVGILGLGTVGLAVARTINAYDCKIIANSAHPHPIKQELAFLGGPEDLDLILSQSDFVVIALPLNETTQGSVNPNKVKEGAYIINVARSKIVSDEHALLQRIKSGELRGAALDVYLQISNADCGNQNIILTPHIAGITDYSVNAVCKFIAEKIRTLS